MLDIVYHVPSNRRPIIPAIRRLQLLPMASAAWITHHTWRVDRQHSHPAYWHTVISCNILCAERLSNWAVIKYSAQITNSFYTFDGMKYATKPKVFVKGRKGALHLQQSRARKLLFRRMHAENMRAHRSHKNPKNDEWMGQFVKNALLPNWSTDCSRGREAGCPSGTT